jgi:NAD(P)H dehydrogenase (quinone)
MFQRNSRKDKLFNHIVEDQEKASMDERGIVSVKVQIVFYSMYGHIWRLAEAVAKGAGQVPGASVEIFQVPELVPDAVLEQAGAKAARAAFGHIPVAAIDRLAEADCLFIGSPTRFGNMAAQMRNFLDQTGGLWSRGALVGKVGSCFTSTASQHGGQETTLVSMHTTLLHHGMVVAGIPYADARLANIQAVSGGTPYGASTITGSDGKRLPSEDELGIAQFQGQHVTALAAALVRGRAA